MKILNEREIREKVVSGVLDQFLLHGKEYLRIQNEGGHIGKTDIGSRHVREVTEFLIPEKSEAEAILTENIRTQPEEWEPVLARFYQAGGTRMKAMRFAVGIRKASKFLQGSIIREAYPAAAKRAGEDIGDLEQADAALHALKTIPNIINDKGQTLSLALREQQRRKMQKEG